MTFAIVPREDREYTPLGCRAWPEELQTTFLYRDLTEAERASVQDIATGNVVLPSGEVVRASTQGAQIMLALRIALKDTKDGAPLRGWDEKANRVVDLPFERRGDGVVSDAYLRRIPWDVQVELYNEVLTKAALDARAVGKLALSQLLSRTANSPAAPSTAGAPTEEGSATTDGPSTPSESESGGGSTETSAESESE